MMGVQTLLLVMGKFKGGTTSLTGGWPTYILGFQKFSPVQVSTNSADSARDGFRLTGMTREPGVRSDGPIDKKRLRRAAQNLWGGPTVHDRITDVIRTSGSNITEVASVAAVSVGAANVTFVFDDVVHDDAGQAVLGTGGGVSIAASGRYRITSSMALGANDGKYCGLAIFINDVSRRTVSGMNTAAGIVMHCEAVFQLLAGDLIQLKGNSETTVTTGYDSGVSGAAARLTVTLL